MKFLRVLVSLFAPPIFILAQTPGLGPLTNQRVILLVQSGVRVSEVVRVIGDSPSVSFNLTPSDTDQLLRAGVSDDTIKIMARRELGLDPMDNARHTPDNLGRLRNASFNPDIDQPGIPPQVHREALIVSESTPVRLRLTRNLSSTDARANDIAHFEVLEDVSVINRSGSFLVIKRGATAWGDHHRCRSKETDGPWRQGGSDNRLRKACRWR